MSDNDISKFWNDRDAVLALAQALDTVKRIEDEKVRWEWGMPSAVERERDNATDTAKAAVRFLCSDDEE